MVKKEGKPQDTTPPLKARFSLGLADAEDLGAAAGALSLSSRAVIFHRNRLSVLNFNLLATFNTICLHFYLLELVDLRQEIIT